MILVFAKVCLPLLDFEILQIRTGMLSKSEECCSAVRLLRAAILKQASTVGADVGYELSTLFSPIVHYTNISYGMIDFLCIDRFVLSFVS